MAIFVPALEYGLVNWHDEIFLLNNPHFRGMGRSELGWMFTTFYGGSYQPLSWLTFALDHLFWGMDPFGFHLTNLMIHGLNAMILYFIAVRLLSLALPDRAIFSKPALAAGALFSALLFSLHPLRVESVVWAARKGELLSAFFFLATILFYVKAATPRNTESTWQRRPVLTLSAFLLSLLSKPSAVVLPFVLLLLDIYPLRRLAATPSRWLDPQHRSILVEKIPFFLLALAFGVIAYFAAGESRVLTPSASFAWASAVAQSLYGPLFYLWKSVVPLNLAPLYEWTESRGFFDPWILLGGLFVVIMTTALIVVRNRWAAGLALWVCYLILLLPPLGATEIRPLWAADRFSYLACIGWSLLGGAALAWLARVGLPRARPYFLFPAACMILFALGILTWKQLPIWRNSETLWRYTVARHPDSSSAHYYLGLVLAQQGALDMAVKHYGRSIEIKPSAVAHNELGQLLIRLGQSDAAVEQLRAAVSLDPDAPRALYYLASLISKRGMLEEAARLLRRAVEMAPGDPEIRYDFAIALAMVGSANEAVEQFRATLKLDPNHAQAYYNAGVLLAKEGKSDEAMQFLQKAISSDSGYARAHYQLGIMLIKHGSLEEGIAHLWRAVALEPDSAEAHENLGRALALQGDREEASRHYREAIRLLDKSRNANVVVLP